MSSNHSYQFSLKPNPNSSRIFITYVRCAFRPLFPRPPWPGNKFSENKSLFPRKMSSSKKKKEKVPKKVQLTLFGINKFQMTQKQTKRIGKNEFKVVGEFVRREMTRNGEIKDVEVSVAQKAQNTKCTWSSQKTLWKKTDQNCSKEKSCVFLSGNCLPVHVQRNQREKDIRQRPNLDQNRESASSKVDKRRGSAIRRRYSSREKVEFVDSVNEYLNENGDVDRTVAGYFREILQWRPRVPNPAASHTRPKNAIFLQRSKKPKQRQQQQDLHHAITFPLLCNLTNHKWIINIRPPLILINEFSFASGIKMSQCACITTIGQSPWVNVIHQLQGSLMSWRRKFARHGVK